MKNLEYNWKELQEAQELAATQPGSVHGIYIDFSLYLCYNHKYIFLELFSFPLDETDSHYEAGFACLYSRVCQALACRPSLEFTLSFAGVLPGTITKTLTKAPVVFLAVWSCVEPTHELPSLAGYAYGVINSMCLCCYLFFYDITKLS